MSMIRCPHCGGLAVVRTIVEPYQEVGTVEKSFDEFAEMVRQHDGKVIGYSDWPQVVRSTMARWLDKLGREGKVVKLTTGENGRGHRALYKVTWV